MIEGVATVRWVTEELLEQAQPGFVPILEQ